MHHLQHRQHRTAFLSLVLLVGLVTAALASCAPTSPGTGTSSEVRSGSPTVTLTDVATATPTATATPKPKLQPTATPVPPPNGAGDQMTLGRDVNVTNNGYQIVGQTGVFKAGDQFAYLVQLNAPIGTQDVSLALVEIQANGGEKTCNMWSISQFMPPDGGLMSWYHVYPTAQQLMAWCSPATYKLEVIANQYHVRASAEFQYLG